jgi:nuclear pore complex protein Nup107
VLLRVCLNWHDAVWAHFKVLLDVTFEREIRLYQHPLRPPQVELPSWYLAQEQSPSEIFASVASSANDAVRRGAEEPFHLLQALIIQGDIPAVVEHIHRWITEASSDVAPYHRFLAHLTLFFRELGIPDLQEALCDEIVLAYVKHLIDQRDMEVVASYAARLPAEVQIDTYASFLVNITDKAQRLRCLQLARDAGLDVASITKKVVRYVRSEDFLLEGGTSMIAAAPLDVAPDVKATNERRVTDQDAQKISAIDWLVFDPSQRAEALIQGNALIRDFLSQQKLKAATDVLLKLPRDSRSVVLQNCAYDNGPQSELPAEQEAACCEFEALTAYLESQHAFRSWSDHFFQLCPEEPRSKTSTSAEHARYQIEKARWEENLAKFTELAEGKLLNVIQYPNGWLVDPVLNAETPRERTIQMHELRKLLLPKCVSALHQVYFKSEQFDKCMSIAVLIATSPDLCALFAECKEQLRDVLRLLREASLQLLETADPLGFRA